MTAHDQTLAQALERLVDPVTRGDPMGPLLWTCSSAARLADAPDGAPAIAVSERTVNRLLHELGYSLQANRKTLEGKPSMRTAMRSSNAYQPAGARLPAPCGNQ